MKPNNFVLMALVCAFQISIKKTDAITESEKLAIKLLTKFGYRRTWLPITHSAEMKNMLLSFQSFYGLKQTGTLTDETLEALKKPRCALPDPWDLLEKNPKADYILQGTKWKTKTTITWKITKIPSNLNIQTITETFKRAFARWQKHTEKIKFMESSESKNVDISIQIVSDLHGDPYPFDGKGGSLGHSFYPFKEFGLAGDIHLDADDVKDDTNLEWLATHLIGHSLGIMHNGKHDSVMFPYRKNKKFLDKTFELPGPDIKAIKALYGKEAGKTTESPTKATDVETTTTKNPTKSTPSTTQKISTKTPTKTKSTSAPTILTTKKTSRATTTPSMQPPLNPCPPLDISALVYYEFHKRLLVFTKSDNLMMITGSGHVYTIKRRSFIPTFQGRLMLVDAALMMMVKGKNCMVIFSGEYYFIYHSRYFQFAEGPYSFHQIDNDSPLKLKLPKDVTKIDAAMSWKFDSNLYLFSKATVYKYDVTNKRIESTEKISDTWKGVPDNLDAAFSSSERTYFVKNDMMYQIDNQKRQVEDGYPQHWGKIILNCEKLPSQDKVLVNEKLTKTR